MEIRSRQDICKLLSNNSIGIELGVATGYFSEILLSSKKFKTLYSVDRWSDHHDIKEYMDALRKLSKYGQSSIVIRAIFNEIIDYFPDEYFDFIYIDAYAHNGQDNGEILNKWFPKLKQEGLFSGHDYEKEEWPETYKVVNTFSTNNNLVLNIIDGTNGGINNEDMWKSWYVFK